jgi:hypothetical protein
VEDPVAGARQSRNVMALICGDGVSLGRARQRRSDDRSRQTPIVWKRSACPRSHLPLPWTARSSEVLPDPRASWTLRHGRSLIGSSDTPDDRRVHVLLTTSPVTLAPCRLNRLTRLDHLMARGVSVSGHENLPIGGQESPHWRPGNLPTGGHEGSVRSRVRVPTLRVSASPLWSSGPPMRPSAAAAAPLGGHDGAVAGPPVEPVAPSCDDTGSGVGVRRTLDRNGPRIGGFRNPASGSSAA